jgi:hypothetical protein
MSNFESSSPSFSIHPSMGEELGRCRFYGVEVVTLSRLEVTQRDKLIDAPWPELHTHVSYAVTAPFTVSPHARSQRAGGKIARSCHTYKTMLPEAGAIGAAALF